MITCVHCERPSCLPDDYRPLCSRHQILAIKQAQVDAHKRFVAHIKALAEAKGIPFDPTWIRPLEKSR